MGHPYPEPLRRALKRWLRKWAQLEHNWLPWNRVRIHWLFMRRGAVFRWPIHGNVLHAMRNGQLDVGPEVLMESGISIVVGEHGSVRIGEGCFVNHDVMIGANESVDIGAHCLFGTGCVVIDWDHRHDDPDIPVTRQGTTSAGPIRVGANTWCGANVVITSGVTVGERCVIGANSVVTADLPAFSVAAGVPARIVRTVAPDG
jgi:acetyltransferase-like isoleucine patch superfamily enzyme